VAEVHTLPFIIDVADITF